MRRSYYTDRLSTNIEDLRRYYASLSDEELIAIERGYLTEEAQHCYDEEFAERGLRHGLQAELEPDWIGESASACGFDSWPGNDGAPDAEEARVILEEAKIPCYLKITQMDESEGGFQPHYFFELLVPGAMILHAQSLLDRQLFNAREEAKWRTHFETMSDEDLRGIDVEDLTAGMQDRVARLKHAYTQEKFRRGL